MTDSNVPLRQHIYIAMAYLFKYATDADFHSLGAPKRILELAQDLSDFCNLYASSVADLPIVQLVNETGTEALDAVIDGLIERRRKNESVKLPKDRETLLKLYDRLQHRAARRVNRLIFAQITEDGLKRHIMEQIDGEIEERGALT